MKQEQTRKRLIAKKAKPKTLIQQSFLFQAEKVLAKTVKMLKVFLLRKTLRKITDTKASDSSDTDVVEGAGANWLEQMKNTNHTAIAKLLVENNFPECNISAVAALSTDNGLSSNSNSSACSSVVYEKFLKHKKTVELINALHLKYIDMVVKNNTLRAAEQKLAAKSSNNTIGGSKKNLLSKRPIDKNEVSKGVFFDSLEETENKELDKQAERRKKFRESNGGSSSGGGTSDGRIGIGNRGKNVRPPTRVRNERKQQQQLQIKKTKEFKEGDALPTDINIYLPKEQRPADTATSTAEYMQRLGVGPGMEAGVVGGVTRLVKKTELSSALRTDLSSSYAQPQRNSNGSSSGIDSRTSQQQQHQYQAAESVVTTVASGKDWKATGVHPSWAAKQLAKKTALIAIPSGESAKKYTGLSFTKQPTKIVFDD